MRNFQTEVERFLTDHKMSPSTMGFQALGDYGFVRDLRAGRSPRLSTCQRVKAWMDGYDRRHPVQKRERRKAAERAVVEAVRQATKRGTREARSAS